MKTKTLFLTLTTGFAAALICWAADTKNIEQAVRQLDEEWSKAAATKDVDKVVSYYSDDAIVLPPGSGALTTTDAIRNTWKELLTSPGASISWKTTRVEVSKSGDMAYTSGTYELTMNDPSGKPMNERGKYLEVWVKQADGKWKCGADMWNSNASAEKK